MSMPIRIRGFPYEGVGTLIPKAADGFLFILGFTSGVDVDTQTT